MPEVIKLKDDTNFVEKLKFMVGEIVGTMILVFVGCMSCVPISPTPHLQITIAFGLAVMMAILVVGHISGSHINPAITVAAVTLGGFPLINVPFYIIGQMLGAIIGYGFLMVITPSSFHEGYGPGICTPVLHPELSVFQGLFSEFLATLLLILVACGIWDKRNATKEDTIAIKFGLTITAIAICAGPFAGANMNPARSFAPAVFNGYWKHHWIYWVSPLLAGFIGGLFYRLVFGLKDGEGGGPEN